MTPFLSVGGPIVRKTQLELLLAVSFGPSYGTATDNSLIHLVTFNVTYASMF